MLPSFRSAAISVIQDEGATLRSQMVAAGSLDVSARDSRSRTKKREKRCAAAARVLLVRYLPLRTELRRRSIMPRPRQIFRWADRPVGFLQRFKNFLTSSHCRANFLLGCLEYA